jgi:hypothetical protein
VHPDGKVAAHRALKRLRALTGQGTAFPLASAPASLPAAGAGEGARALSGKLHPSEAGSSSSLGSARPSEAPSGAGRPGGAAPTAGGPPGSAAGAPLPAAAAALRWMGAAGVAEARGMSPTSTWSRTVTRGPDKHRALFEAFEGMRADDLLEGVEGAAARAGAGPGSEAGLGPRPPSGSLSARGSGSRAGSMRRDGSAGDLAAAGGGAGAGPNPEDTASASLQRRLGGAAAGGFGSVQSWPRRVAHGVEERPSIFGAFPQVSAHLGRLEGAATAGLPQAGPHPGADPIPSSRGPPSLPTGATPGSTQSWRRGVVHGAERRRSVLDMFGAEGGEAPGPGPGSMRDAPAAAALRPPLGRAGETPSRASGSGAPRQREAENVTAGPSAFTRPAEATAGLPAGPVHGGAAGRAPASGAAAPAPQAPPLGPCRSAPSAVDADVTAVSLQPATPAAAAQPLSSPAADADPDPGECPGQGAAAPAAASGAHAGADAAPDNEGPEQGARGAALESRLTQVGNAPGKPRPGSERRPSLFDVFPEARGGGGASPGPAAPSHGGPAAARAEGSPSAGADSPEQGGQPSTDGAARDAGATVAPREAQQGRERGAARQGPGAAVAADAAQAGQGARQRPGPQSRLSLDALGAPAFGAGAPESEETWAAGDTRTHTLAQVCPCTHRLHH